MELLIFSASSLTRPGYPCRYATLGVTCPLSHCPPSSSLSFVCFLLNQHAPGFHPGATDSSVHAGMFWSPRKCLIKLCSLLRTDKIIYRLSRVDCVLLSDFIHCLGTSGRINRFFCFVPMGEIFTLLSARCLLLLTSLRPLP